MPEFKAYVRKKFLPIYIPKKIVISPGCIVINPKGRWVRARSYFMFSRYEIVSNVASIRLLTEREFREAKEIYESEIRCIVSNEL